MQEEELVGGGAAEGDAESSSKDGGDKKGGAEAAGKEEEKEDKSASKVTLSGVLNFIDGLWSACGVERIIVFTTNHVDKLDPALIRRGRMDKHIEMSYCCFEMSMGRQGLRPRSQSVAVVVW